jgi:hypothetical protein
MKLLIMKILYLINSLAVWILIPSASFSLRAQSPPSAAEIADILKSNEIRFFSNGDFLLEYARDESTNVVASQYSGNYVRYSYALAKRGHDWLGDESPLLDMKNLGQIQEVISNGLFLDWSRANNSAIVEEVDTRALNIFHKCDYFQHCGINVYRKIIESIGLEYSTTAASQELEDYLGIPLLPHFLSENHGNYKVLPTAEVFDGAACWVIEWSEMDKIWVDSQHGLVRKRVFHWGEGQPRRLEIENRQLTEVATGVLLPFQQVVLKYANMPSESREIWDKVTARLVYNVRSFAFTNVDQLFSVQLPAGTLVQDFKRNVVYTIPREGARPFELPIVEGMSSMEQITPSASSSRKARYILGVTTVVLSLFAVWLVYSRRNR